jgi:hypothetical protein
MPGKSAAMKIRNGFCGIGFSTIAFDSGYVPVVWDELLLSIRRTTLLIVLSLIELAVKPKSDPFTGCSSRI